ncbi:flavin reductase family protein [Ruegeria sp. HKCCD8929]|uniref:flavin reductase family protein n=1 Tax=Ruegeria sp. HKCCD8929 TaxID=2683006 RepID=UPI00148821F9|nr:flavin reductase family protein [Ruegeria sp. HKCCD8929]
MTENSFIPGPGQTLAFREALGCYGTGVAVVTTMAEGVPVAITVNSFTSVSLDPPLVLWCLGEESNRYDAFSKAGQYAIHVMAEGQQDQTLRFARNGWDFSHADWQADASGTPILSGCLARFDCRLHARHQAGDHLIIVGEVLRAMHRTGKGLMFKRGQYGAFTDLL